MTVSSCLCNIYVIFEDNSKCYKWKKYCVWSAAGADNANVNSNNIIFTIKKSKLYVSNVTLSARENQKLSKRLSNRFER